MAKAKKDKLVDLTKNLGAEVIGHDFDINKFFDSIDVDAPSEVIDTSASPKLSTTQILEARLAIEEYARRQFESLKIFEPTPAQQKVFDCVSRWRIVVGSNRGGKTLTAAVEVARALCGKDPKNKYPLKDGRAIIVGKKLQDCGKVQWRKLANAGAFKMIRDETTGLWRAYRPWIKGDVDRKSDTRLAPPLIPNRFIADISWEDKKEKIPKTVYLKTGWEATFFSSDSDPPNGWDIDVAWFDEEIIGESWPSEIYARILDRRGFFLWSATPQNATQGLYALHERAEKENLVIEEALKEGRVPPERKVSEFNLQLDLNPHIDDDVKEDFASVLTEDEYDVRYQGNYALNQLLVYGEYRKDVHGIDTYPIPWEWTRFMTIDPGVQVCGILCAAVPPVGNEVIFYQEFYIQRADPKMVADLFKSRMGEAPFYDFIMDMRFGRQTNAGTGRTTAEHYASAFHAAGIRCLRHARGFTHASDDVTSGITAVKNGLALQDDGNPRFKFMWRQLPMLSHEIRRYANKRDPKTKLVTNTPDSSKFHMMDCLRYMSMCDLRYRRPPQGSVHPSSGYLLLQRKKLKNKQGNSGKGISLS